ARRHLLPRAGDSVRRLSLRRRLAGAGRVDHPVQRRSVCRKICRAARLNNGTDRDNISYSYLTTNVVLPQQVQFSGYLHTGWTTADGTPITQDEVYDAADDNGIHLYVVWTPIEYTIEYIITDESGGETATYTEE